MSKEKKAKQPKPEKPQKREEWVSFSREVYIAEIDKLVHFSVKAVNSNARSGGVRLHGLLDLPYLAVSSLGASGVSLDYLSNVGQRARIAKQVNSVLDGTVDARFGLPGDETLRNINDDMARIDSLDISDDKKKKEKSDSRKKMFATTALLPVPDSEKQVIRSTIESLGAANLTDNSIDCHIKQVLMPDMSGLDVSLSPLHSAGLSKMINEAEVRLLAQDNAGLKSSEMKKRLVRRAVMDYGGANPQNIGGLTHFMQRPIFAVPPKENPTSRLVFSAHFNGLPAVTNVAIDNFLAVTDRQQVKRDNGRTEGMMDREEFRRALAKLVRDTLNRADKTYQLLLDNAGLLPADKLGCPILLDDQVTADKVKSGLIFREQRDAVWREAFSHLVANKIAGRSRQAKGVSGELVKIGSGLSDQDILDMRSIIEGEVLS